MLTYTNRALDLEDLPPDIEDLKSLTKHPHVPDFPSSQEAYYPLEAELRLFLANNRFVEIPHHVFQLRNLRVLSLRNNRLASLPPAIGVLQMLRTLNISANKLESLPAELLELIQSGSLKELIADPNPWTQVPEWATERNVLTPVSIRTSSVGLLTALSPVQLLKPSGAVDGVSTGHQECRSPKWPGAQSTLVETALTKLIKLQAFPSIFASAIENVDGPILDVLKVGMNASLFGKRRCACGRSFTLPRQQWIEWWSFSTPGGFQLSNIPFLRQVCNACPKGQVF